MATKLDLISDLAKNAEVKVLFDLGFSICDYHLFDYRKKIIKVLVIGNLCYLKLDMNDCLDLMILEGDCYKYEHIIDKTIINIHILKDLY